jgi:uncharacterized membrane-anchored protein YjiN (DUF445 family)
MIGAIADWFAVVALFRHPLGLPIPHTAIIPSNKARIGRELADFICGNFLSTPQVLDKLRTFDPAAQVARWLSDERHADRLAGYAMSAARFALVSFDDERVRGFVGGAMLQQLRRLDVSQIAGQVLDVVTAQGRHQALLDDVLRQVARVMNDPEVQARVADAIAVEVKVLRYVGLDQMAGTLAARKMVAGIGRLIGEMGEDPAHELRLRFDRTMATYVDRLKHDPAVRERAEALKQQVLQDPALAGFLQGLWGDVVGWLRSDLDSPRSVLHARAAELARTMGTRLAEDRAMQQWLNEQVLAAAPQAIDRYREDIRRYIASRVDAWDTAEMTDELERNIGRDLQFVRINGTLVGGLIGLAIYTATRWLT